MSDEAHKFRVTVEGLPSPQLVPTDTFRVPGR
ncbi:MAG: hypothetical protein U5O39_08845 [Gammaproteobacteria bacterium]|nr:hypothetical protein [Gammaproteobacteria bacterium]